jgi:hypothetical protein
MEMMKLPLQPSSHLLKAALLDVNFYDRPVSTGGLS